MMVREGAAIPHIELAQSTRFMDWSKINLRVFSDDGNNAEALICLPDEQKVKKVELKKTADGFEITTNPFGNKVTFSVN